MRALRGDGGGANQSPSTGTVSPVTLNGYRGIADTHLRPALGDSDAAALTRDDVVAARNAWIAAGASGLVIGRALGYLRSAYQRAVDDGRLPRNPVSGVKAPKHQPEGRRAWSQDDARRFLAHAATDRLGALWALSLLGLRRSEVLGLQWQDWTPATDTGPGVVRVRRAGECLALGVPLAPDAWLSVDEAGDPVHPGWYSRRFGELCKEAGVPVLRLHEARTTAATILRERGVATDVAAAYLGHDAVVYERTYVKTSPERARLAADALEF